MWCGSPTGQCWSPDIWNHTTGECPRVGQGGRVSSHTCTTAQYLNSSINRPASITPPLTGECWLKYQKGWDNDVDRSKSNLAVNRRGSYSPEFRREHKTAPGGCCTRLGPPHAPACVARRQLSATELRLPGLLCCPCCRGGCVDRRRHPCLACCSRSGSNPFTLPPPCCKARSSVCHCSHSGGGAAAAAGGWECANKPSAPVGWAHCGHTRVLVLSVVARQNPSGQAHRHACVRIEW